MVFLVGILFWVVLEVENMVVWWSVFLLMDLVFIFLCKSSGSYSAIINYFVIQESLGLIFLVMNFLTAQFVVVMAKMGMAPFHFWIFSIVSGLEGWLLLWFLTFQKLPLFGVLLALFFEEVIVILVLGFLVCYFQILLLGDYKFMVSVSSTESFNWILLTYTFSLLNSLALFVYYFLASLFLVPYFTKKVSGEMEWVTLLVFMNVPLGAAFFVKIYALGGFMASLASWVVLVLSLMVMSSLSLGLWLTMKSVKIGALSYFNSSGFFALLVLLVAALLYSSSKFIMLPWWGGVSWGTSMLASLWMRVLTALQWTSLTLGVQGLKVRTSRGLRAVTVNISNWTQELVVSVPGKGLEMMDYSGVSTHMVESL